MGYGGRWAGLGSHRPDWSQVWRRMRGWGGLDGGHILISSAWNETLSDLEAFVSFSKWHSFSFDVEAALVRCSESSACSLVLKVLLSTADTRVLPHQWANNPRCEACWLLLSQRISDDLKERRRTLRRVSSWHWSQPTAGLQEEGSPLIQDQNHNFSNSSPESTVTVWHLWQGDAFRARFIVKALHCAAGMSLTGGQGHPTRWPWQVGF